MTDGVTDDIDWIEGARITGSIPGLELKKKAYILYMYYISYIIYILYISYMHIIYFIYCIYT